MTWTITTKKTPVTKKTALIVGLPGIGNIGKITVDFLIDTKKATHIASFHSHAIPHTVFVNENNLIELPSIELYHLPNKKGTDLLLLSGDTQPIDERAAHAFCETLLDYCTTLGCTEIITIGGIALKQIPKKPKLYATSTHKKYLTNIQGPDKNLYGIVGPIMGITGILPAHAGQKNIPNICLLADTLGHPMYLGIPGAKEILKTLEKHYNLTLDYHNMDKDIHALEAELQRSLPPQPRKKEEISYIG